MEVYEYMSERFIKRLKKRIVISTLTMFVILSQTVPTIVNAATNDDIMNAINNDIGTEIGIVIEEDAIEAPAANPVVKERSESATNDNWTSNTSRYSTRSYSSGYSPDGREYLDVYTNVWYKTAKYWSEQHPDLKEDLDNYFGEKNLVKMGDINGIGDRTCLWDAITYKDQVYKALKSKTQREQLAKIAVENDIIAKETYKAAPYVALFEYYGIINRADGLLDYSNSTKAYLSREQAALMLGRFMHPDAFFGSEMKENKNDAYKAYTDYYGRRMLLGFGADKGEEVTAKELSSNMTRLEFIYLITERYFRDDVYEARQDGSDTDAAKIFKDIDKGDYGTAELYKKEGVYGKGDNNINRVSLKYKKLDRDMDAHIQAAYKLGILKKDSKGDANLFKNVTYSEAVRMLINAGLSIPDGKAIPGV